MLIAHEFLNTRVVAGTLWWTRRLLMFLLLRLVLLHAQQWCDWRDVFND
jgi:hypothetical protein